MHKAENFNVDRLWEIVGRCRLCPRRCDVDRTAGQTGACRIGPEAVVVSAGPHFGEEPVLVGRGGSGTIFFAGCNLDCVFCQNDNISHSANGPEISADRVAEIALGLQREGCENVNFVTPTHVAHVVARAVVAARRRGCSVPIVYNCGGYESVETLALLQGLVDIYMPDFKYADPAAGERYSGVADYPEVATAALAEMVRQVGVMAVDDRGVGVRGVLVRHLVMPGDLARSRDVIDSVARVAPGCTINVMGQYRPACRAAEFPELCAPVGRDEVRALRHQARSRGLVPVD